jgi:hypothetical protein
MPPPVSDHAVVLIRFSHAIAACSLTLRVIISAGRAANNECFAWRYRARYAGVMDIRTIAQRLSWIESPLETGPTHVFYDGLYLGSIATRSKIGPPYAWMADCRGIYLGEFPTRDAARHAIVAWITGLEIEQWAAQDETTKKII